MTQPFDYPAQPHVRRHDPLGYADYPSFRPWLRDEFRFRCVYCLRRENWGRVYGEFAVDHFLPVKQRPELTTVYTNLLYVCGPCNLKKADQLLADPLVHLLSDQVSVNADGTIVVQSAACQQIVEVMQLDRPDMVEFRKLWMGLLRLVTDHDEVLYRQILGFPADLPDLSRLQPPGGNTKPEGIEQSYFFQRERGELPETY